MNTWLQWNGWNVDLQGEGAGGSAGPEAIVQVASWHTDSTCTLKELRHDILSHFVQRAKLPST